MGLEKKTTEKLYFTMGTDFSELLYVKGVWLDSITMRRRGDDHHCN